jgi:hypothetical protein
MMVHACMDSLGGDSDVASAENHDVRFGNTRATFSVALPRGVCVLRVACCVSLAFGFMRYAQLGYGGVLRCQWGVVWWGVSG